MIQYFLITSGHTGDVTDVTDDQMLQRLEHLADENVLKDHCSCFLINLILGKMFGVCPLLQQYSLLRLHDAFFSVPKS